MNGEKFGGRRAALAAAVAVAGAGLLAGEAQAVTYTENFANYTCGGGTCTGSDTTGSQTTDYLATFNIPKFDSSLGTLTQIIVNVSGSMNATGSVTNNGTLPAGGVVLLHDSTITTDPTQNVFGSSGLATITTGSNGGDSNLSFTTSASAFQPAGTGHVDAGETVSGIPLDGTFTTLSLNQTSGFDTNLFALGGGVFAISFGTGEFTSTTSADSGLVYSADNSDTINMSIQYQYTPATTAVPEPASLALLGTALAALGLTRRRKREAA